MGGLILPCAQKVDCCDLRNEMQQDEKNLRSVSVLPPNSGGTTQDCHKLKLFSISSATDSPRQFLIKAEKNMYW